MANIKRLERVEYLFGKTTYVALSKHYVVRWPFPDKRSATVNSETGDIIEATTPKEKVDRRIRYLVSRHPPKNIGDQKKLQSIVD